MPSPRVCSATPLVTEDAIGVLYLQANRERYRFDGEDMAFLGAFAKQLALALDRARMHQTERQQSGVSCADAPADSATIVS